jgi:hypothetical protein
MQAPVSVVWHTMGSPHRGILKMGTHRVFEGTGGVRLRVPCPQQIKPFLHWINESAVNKFIMGESSPSYFLEFRRFADF